MPRYAVKVDTSWGFKGYDEIVVEAETAAKAKYKAAKCFGSSIKGMGGKEFGYFITLFKLEVQRVPDDTPLWYKSFTDANPEREMRLVWIGMAKEKIESGAKMDGGKQE